MTEQELIIIFSGQRAGAGQKTNHNMRILPAARQDYENTLRTAALIEILIDFPTARIKIATHRPR